MELRKALPWTAIIVGIATGLFALFTGDSEVYIVVIAPVIILGPIGIIALFLIVFGVALSFILRANVEWTDSIDLKETRGVIFLGPIPIPLGRQKMTPLLIIIGIIIFIIMAAAFLFLRWSNA